MEITEKKKIKSFFCSPDVCWGSVLILILGAVYIATLLPGVGYQCDTAKFQFVGRVLGTPHPTGFPTYILLNHLFTTFFPFGHLAFRANLLSAIFAVFACLILYLTLKGIFAIKRALAFLTALTFGVTFSFWSQSIVAEVYTLHILFVITIIYTFLKWRQTGKEAYFFSACFLYAISFGNHPTVIFFLPAIVYVTWATDKKVFVDLKKIAVVLLFIIIGAVQYGYLFWRYYSPDTPYLEMATPDLERFFWYITGAQFKSRMFSFSLPELVIHRVPVFLKQILDQYLFLIPVALWGMFKWRDKTIHIFLWLLFLGNMIPAIDYDIAEIFVYLIPNYLILALYIGIGLDSIHALLKKKGIALVSYAMILIPLFFFLVNHSKMKPFNDTFHQKRVEAVLQLVKTDALIISPDDFYSQYFWYYLIGEKMSATRHIYLMHHYDFTQVKDYIQHNRPIYLREERKYVPIGLKVYFMNTSQNQNFKQAGFNMHKIRHYLYKVN